MKCIQCDDTDRGFTVMLYPPTGQHDVSTEDAPVSRKVLTFNPFI